MTTTDSQIAKKLEVSRRELLDLTARNRLIHTPRGRTRANQVEIISELSEETFSCLVRGNKPMSFLPSQTSKAAGDQGADVGRALTSNLFDDEQSDDDSGQIEVNEESEHDEKLQTNLTGGGLQTRLLKLFYDARTFEEEQGVGILYLALGFLKYFEDDRSEEPRYAPLVLVPTDLQRSSIRASFRLSWTGDDITTNLSLQEKLRLEFSAKLPSIPEDDDWSLSEYFAAVRSSVSAHRRWEVEENAIVLGFFSFSKFLMFRDLQPENWPEEKSVIGDGLIPIVLGDGFGALPSVFNHDTKLDPILLPAQTFHVVDADSSQAMAIEETRQGRNLVIQGPPGTGKSQTITNLIASAVKDGKRVLFVAEKMAALEVVKRRLDDIGLGPICLELHSHKANKRAVVEELARNLRLGPPKVDDVHRQAKDLRSYRDRLNQYAELLHTLIDPSGLTPYRLMGELVRLRNASVPPSKCRLQQAVTWDVEAFHERRAALADLAIQLERVGRPERHAWRGVRADAVLPTDRDRAISALPMVLQRLQRLAEATEEIGSRMGLNQVATALDASKAAQFAKKLLEAPPVDRASLAHPVWHERRDAIDNLIAQGKRLAACQAELQQVVADVAWSTDVAQARRDLAAHGHSWFRFFSRAYRSSVTTLRSVLKSELPKTYRERLEIFDELIAGQQANQRVIENDGVGASAFGTLWRGSQSDWGVLERIAEWEQSCRIAGLPNNFRELWAEPENGEALTAALKQVAANLKPMLQELETIFTQVGFSPKVVFGSGDPKQIPLRSLHEHLRAWLAAPDELFTWMAYFNRYRRLEGLGLGEFAQQIEQEKFGPKEVIDQFEAAYFEEIYRSVYQRFPLLAEFDGASHEKLIEQFIRLDIERQFLARQEVVQAHYERMPLNGAEVGEVGIVRREIGKKRGHVPLRKLLKEAGRAIQHIKPVFMMSPISVAQFLEPGTLDFDLLVIDEASQVRPVDALGAIARARQIVVVGDDKQLPPTRFFSSVLSDQDEDVDDSTELRTGDIESILGLCLAQGLKPRMLRWHYRSRHHSLIAVSNFEFYDHGLFVVPSPFSAAAEYGLRFRFIPNGIFDRGKSATNRSEAAAVADAVIEFARKHPKKSLGVGTFSVAQRDAILDELELRRRMNPDAEGFFSQRGVESFFVKNLENIQGDERDVIFISVGYAKDCNGRFAMQFGPLGSEGGERRLNVLITRAKERCEVFSSITADDIDLGRTNSRGARSLKTFLRYAQTGKIDMPMRSGRDHNSEFERQVAHAIRGLGYEVDCEVDESGFFIDLAVIDPQKPGRYLLGIECDGASYHSARWARDRDRLRQQVLEDRGWIIHRIWSTDWFQKPEKSLRKVAAAIDQAQMIVQQRDQDQSSTRPNEEEIEESTPTILRYERAEDGDGEAPLVETVAYVEACFTVKNSKPIHEVPVKELAKMVRKIVEIEGPVHQDEITKRVVTLWGLQRAGSRIKDAVESALCEAKDRGWLVQEDEFFSSPTQSVPAIRNRENVSSPGLRTPAMLPPAEVRRAVTTVVQSSIGASTDEIAGQVARLLGFKATSGSLKQVIEGQSQALITEQLLQLRNGRLFLTSPEAARAGS